MYNWWKNFLSLTPKLITIARIFGVCFCEEISIWQIHSDGETHE